MHFSADGPVVRPCIPECQGAADSHSSALCSGTLSRLQPRIATVKPFDPWGPQGALLQFLPLSLSYQKSSSGIKRRERKRPSGFKIQATAGEEGCSALGRITQITVALRVRLGPFPSLVLSLSLSHTVHPPSHSCFFPSLFLLY